MASMLWNSSVSLDTTSTSESCRSNQQAVNVSDKVVRPRVLPLAGLLFETMILAFPLLAGWVISGSGYGAVFVLLVLLCVVQVVLGWERFLVSRKNRGMRKD
ncbi:MAG: hypothetical protein ICV31_05890 [Rubrobacter sp.]|nr:hypothetical protein [Rubrobacter sp.]